jgi:drug/metabolite transporter (DMT)-like permease
MKSQTINKQRGIVFSILTSIMFGVSPIFVKLVLDVTNIETMNILWAFISSILFGLLFIFSKKTKHYKIIIKNWRKIALLGLFSIVGSLFYAYGIFYSDPINATFIIQFAKIFTIMFGIIFLKERFTKLEGFGVIIALIGVFFLTFGNFKIEILNSLILLVASFFFAIGNFFSKVYIKKVNPITLAGGRVIFMFLFVLTFSIFFGRIELNIPLIVVFYAILGSITGLFLSFILYFKALEVFDLSKSTVIRTSEPFLTAIFSFIILFLIPTYNQLFGGILVVMGVIILSLAKEK